MVMPFKALNNLIAADMFSLLVQAEVQLYTATLGAGSWGRMHAVNNSGSTPTITLPTYTGAKNRFLGIRNISSTASLVVNVTTVDAAYPSYNRLYGGESIIIMSTGSSYVVVGGQRNPTTFSMYSSAQQANLASGAQVVLGCTAENYDLRAVATNGYFEASRKGNYLLSGCVGIKCATGTFTAICIEVYNFSSGAVVSTVYKGASSSPANTLVCVPWTACIVVTSEGTNFYVRVTCTTSDASVWTIEPSSAPTGQVTYINGLELL
jgi:hypothetical protein